MGTALLASRTAVDLVNPPAEASVSFGAEAILKQSSDFTSLLSKLGSLTHPDRPYDEGSPPTHANLDKLASLTAKLEAEQARRLVETKVAEVASNYGDDTSIPVEVLQEMLAQELRNVAEAKEDFGRALAGHEQRVQRRVQDVMEEAQAEDELTRLTRAQNDLVGVHLDLTLVLLRRSLICCLPAAAHHLPRARAGHSPSDPACSRLDHECSLRPAHSLPRSTKLARADAPPLGLSSRLDRHSTSTRDLGRSPADQGIVSVIGQTTAEPRRSTRYRGIERRPLRRAFGRRASENGRRVSCLWVPASST
jgi:hypothetical protein